MRKRQWKKNFKKFEIWLVEFAEACNTFCREISGSIEELEIRRKKHREYLNNDPVKIKEWENENNERNERI